MLSFDDGRSWRTQKEPKCSGLVEASGGVLCWEGALDNRRMADQFGIYFATRPYERWQRVFGAPNWPASHVDVGGVGLVYEWLEYDAQGDYKTKPWGIFDLSTLSKVGESPVGRLWPVPDRGAAEQWLRNRRSLPALPDGGKWLSVQGNNCWALANPPTIFHTQCDSGSWKRIASFPELVFGPGQYRKPAVAAANGTLFVTQPSTISIPSKIGVFEREGSARFYSGPASYVLGLRADNRGELWATTMAGIVRDRRQRGNWVQALPSLSCGSDLNRGSYLR